MFPPSNSTTINNNLEEINNYSVLLKERFSTLLTFTNLPSYAHTINVYFDLYVMFIAVCVLSASWEDIIHIEKGEQIIASLEGEHELPASRRPPARSGGGFTVSLSANKVGYIVFTNRRIFFVEKRGVFTETYAVVLDIRYEDIIGVSTGGTLLRHLSITDKNDEEHRFHLYRGTPTELIPYIKQFMDARQEEIEEEKAKERVQIVADFSFLKSVMEKGRIVLQVISCPFCGASVPIPETGKVFKCNYCKKDIYAVDVFKKIKELMSESTREIEKPEVILPTWLRPRLPKTYPKGLITKYQHMYPHNPEGVLEFHISRKMKEGKTREEAIGELARQSS